MENIPTAIEFLKGCEHDGSYIPVSEVKMKMIDFAKLHVEAALRTAANKAKAYIGEDSYNMRSEVAEVNKESILEAYPEENIK